MSNHKRSTSLIGGLHSVLQFVTNHIFAVFAAILVLNLILGGLATEYVVETWAAVFKGQPVDVSFALCAVVGLFLGELFIPAALATLLLAVSGII